MFWINHIEIQLGKGKYKMKFLIHGFLQLQVGCWARARVDICMI